MLFDLRGRGRRNVIKVVYVLLAVLMGGGLVLFGIGGNQNGGLVDAFTGSSGAPAGADAYEDDIRAARARLQTDPKDEAAWVDLIRAQTSLANTGDQFDPNTGAYTEAGQADLRDAVASWESYQKIDPANDDEEARIASVIVRSYLALEDIEGLVAAQEVVALNREAVGPYSQLAQFAYLAGQTRKGDLAAKKALQLEDPEDRQALKTQLDSAKAQTEAQAAVPSVTPAPSASATGTPENKPSGKAKAKPSGKAKAKPSDKAKAKPSGKAKAKQNATSKQSDK